MKSEEYRQLIVSASQAVISIAPTLPDYQSVQGILARCEEASTRGYFLPDEDEEVREMFARYLSGRAALMLTLQELKPIVKRDLKSGDHRRPELFVIAFCIACLLVRSGRFLVDKIRKDRVVWRKLDEAEPVFGIPKKQFTKIFRSVTSPRNIWNFINAERYWRANQEQLQKLSNDKLVGRVLAILNEEDEFIEASKSYYATRRLKYRWHSFLRRHHSGFKNVMFSMFELSGRLIAELRWKWKRKRVTPGVRKKIAKMLRPGDVIVTRHDDAASNLFLPGYWPHSALHIGLVDERRRLGVELNDDRWRRSSGDIRLLEAMKDGVHFRQLDATLSVDAFVVIRPQLTEEQIRDGLSRGIAHEGKEYDFEFDFRRSNRLVCTEVIYRTYHGIGGIEFKLSNRAGRVCLSAEDLLDHAVDDRGFEVIAMYGYKGNRFVMGPRAKQLLKESYRDSAK